MGGYYKVPNITCVLELEPIVVCKSSVTGMNPRKQSVSTPQNLRGLSVGLFT